MQGYSHKHYGSGKDSLYERCRTSIERKLTDALVQVCLSGSGAFAGLLAKSICLCSLAALGPLPRCYLVHRLRPQSWKLLCTSSTDSMRMLSLEAFENCFVPSVEHYLQSCAILSFALRLGSNVFHH